MEVIRAKAAGMCFGVRDALAAARTLKEPEATTIYGELVHNEAVRSELLALGFEELPERERERRALRAQVLITAHGISQRTRTRLQSQARKLFDTTCPLVRSAHRIASELAAEGRHVLLLGRHGHVEVEGLIQDLPSADVVQSIEDVRTWPDPRLGILCQTTLTEGEAHALRREIRLANPQADIVYRDTICEPTKERQRALDELLEQVPAIVVVGGNNSNNSRKLCVRCESAGLPAFLVQGVETLPVAELVRFDRVGLTAGTSTTPEAIDAVERALRELVPVPSPPKMGGFRHWSSTCAPSPSPAGTRCPPSV